MFFSENNYFAVTKIKINGDLEMLANLKNAGNHVNQILKHLQDFSE